MKRTRYLLSLLMAVLAIALVGCQKEEEPIVERIGESQELSLYADIINYEMSEYFAHLNRFNEMHHELKENATSISDTAVQEELWGIANLYTVKASAIPTLPIPTEAEKTHDELIKIFNKQKTFFDDYMAKFDQAVADNNAQPLIAHVETGEPSIEELRTFLNDRGFKINDNIKDQANASTEEGSEQ